MIPCFIVARSTSERLPKKHFLKLGDVAMIEHVVKRCQFFGLQTYICVPDGEYETFSEQTSCLDIFEGSPDNVEQRVLECAHHYKIKTFHCLDGDDPWFDPFAVFDSFQAARTQRLWRVTPSYHSQSGSGRMGTTYNLEAPQGGDRNLLDTLSDYPWPQRLTVDYPEDYTLARMVMGSVGGYMAPRVEIDRLFFANPDLHKINWFRNLQWKARQDAELRRGIRETVCIENRS